MTGCQTAGCTWTSKNRGSRRSCWADEILVSDIYKKDFLEDAYTSLSEVLPPHSAVVPLGLPSKDMVHRQPGKTWKMLAKQTAGTKTNLAHRPGKRFRRSVTDAKGSRDTETAIGTKIRAYAPQCGTWCAKRHTALHYCAFETESCCGCSACKPDGGDCYGRALVLKARLRWSLQAQTRGDKPLVLPAAAPPIADRYAPLEKTGRVFVFTHISRTGGASFVSWVSTRRPTLHRKTLKTYAYIDYIDIDMYTTPDRESTHGSSVNTSLFGAFSICYHTESIIIIAVTRDCF